MKVVFFSNYLSIHQIPFCEEMNRMADFTFVATTPFNKERLQHGYTDLSKNYSFVLDAYNNDENVKLAEKLAQDADIMILGHAPYRYVKLRLRLNKITFMCSERPCKENDVWYRDFIRSVKYRMKYPKSKPLYMLCASSYTASDFAKYGAFIGKCYKWGYFPKMIEHSNSIDIIKNKEKNSIIWVARMLELKHPDICVRLADELRKHRYSFHIKMIGDGPIRQKIEKQINDLKLNEYITLCGVLTPDEVRNHMDKAQAFLFTSDRNEGWGAVLNESMNSLCIPISSIDAGGTNFLIDEGVNGFKINIRQFDKLIEIVENIFNNGYDTETVAQNAYKTISSTWNAQEAARRLLVLYENLKDGEETTFESGPCSKSN